MRIVVVTGGRNYRDLDKVDSILDAVHAESKEAMFLVTGAAPGADSLAEHWAKRRGVQYVLVPALWDAQGKAAGPNRNGFMGHVAESLAAYSSDRPVLLVAFPGDRGTAHMTDVARTRKWMIWEIKA